MAYTKTIALATALLMFAACDQSATDPGASMNVAVQSALMGAGGAFADGGPQPAIMGRLVHAAIAKIGHDAGADSARATGAHLKTLVDAAHTAREAGDSAAAHTAMDAVRTAEATIVVAAFGTDVVTRSLDYATLRVDMLNDRIAKGGSSAEERPRLTALAASLTQMLADANAAAAAGDNVAALIGAAKIIEAMHIVNDHREIGPRGTLPLDTTRVRRRP